jgi:hypothetical protein
MDRVRCMLDHAGHVKKYCAFAGSVAVYHKIPTVTRSLVGKTPYKAWPGRKRLLKHLRVFGCLAFVHIPNENRMRLDDRATPGIFVG